MRNIIIITLFFLVSITWGTTWVAMKIVIDTIPPFFATGMRFLLAAPLLIIMAYYSNKPLLFPPGERYFQFFICIFYFSIPFSLMLYGGLYVNAYVSSIIFSNMPIFILITSFFLLKKKIFFLQKIGLTIAIIILIFILFNAVCIIHDCQFKGIVALILAVISHAIMYVKCKKKSYNVSVLTFNALPSLISGVILLILAWFFEHPVINNFSKMSILAVIYLGDFSGICGILSYFYLQKKVNSFHASIVFLVFPFIATILDYYIFECSVPINQLLLTIPLMFGILLTLIPSKMKNNI
ncbi:DMT family transporter [Buchnera aphidicola (Pemphigus obesinymphae)]|uniref:DMT family transporter n=1 Tax=Buchnera aphidicola TaxID=9 RepID=UPI0022377821|nr:DMT family transporter [Buchnera aphidicola]MCW5196691.1 DMT family transporter [Buchnera aphidicola (Pemphigus obesinymphae)]